MADIQFYEKIIKPSARGKILSFRILLIVFYLFFATLALIIPLKTQLPPTVCIITVILLLAVVVPFTWKYTCVEYELSFSAGTLTFSRIYGKRTKSTVFYSDIKSMSEISIYSGNVAAKFKHYEPYTLIDALDNKSDENAAYLVFDAEDEKKVIFLFPADEQSVKIFKFFNPQATDRELLKKF